MTEKPADVLLKVQPMPTHASGDVILAPCTHVEIHVKTANEQPAIGADVLVRDRAAHLWSEGWFKTNGNGLTTIRIVGNPTVVVIVYKNILVKKELDNKITGIVIQLPPN